MDIFTNTATFSYGKPHGKFYSHEIVSTLLKSGAIVNHPDANGQTPLHLSAKNGHFQSSMVLLRGGADTNAKDFEGKTPLHCIGQEMNSPGVEQVL